MDYRRERSIAEILMELFVDDPHVSMRGTPERIKFNTAKLIAGWSLLGFPLALHKLHKGEQVQWVGRFFTIDLLEQCVKVEIPEEKLDELREMTRSFMQGNVVPLKQLRTYTGKLQAVASLIIFLRPFASPCWAVMYSSPSGAPTNYVWTAQMKVDYRGCSRFWRVIGAGSWCAFSACGRS